MYIAVIRDLTARASVMLALSLALLCAAIAGSQAQTNSASQPPPEKVEQLLKLLDDPDVKTWIATKSAPPLAEEPVGASASDFMLWSNAIRAHLRGIGQAMPAVPGEFSAASSTIMTEINGRGPGAILGSVRCICSARSRGRTCLPASCQTRWPTACCAGTVDEAFPRPPPHHRPVDFRRDGPLGGLRCR